MTTASPERADYGIDAPAVLRNLFVVGVSGISVWSIAFFAVWYVQLHPSRFWLGLAGASLNCGVLCTLMGFWILYESTIGKKIKRDRLLDQFVWTGREHVLDVGCGRGLILIGAAKRLSNGTATGIDIWQAEDLTGNHADAVLENARREGVAQKVDVQTADMRQMPFANDTFDVVVSRAAIHNIYKAEGREKAIREIVRVLKPGGCAAIDDIRHLRQYARIFSESGCTVVRRTGSVAVQLVLMILTVGSLRPGTILVRKSSGRG
jgi:SAM-dependent methyltransferase